jgi:penicillin amidase
LGVLVLVAGALAASPAGAADGLRAVNIVPPGQSGATTLTQFGLATGLGTSFGLHTDDQLGLYASWQYKPMQFAGPGGGAQPPGNANVAIARDAAYGVPTITATTDADAYYGVGYAMAQDRLFQLEVFRHVGHGTLAELVGASGIDMDKAIRRYSEGATARRAEFDALPAADRIRGQRFVDGINAYVAQVADNPLARPAEYTLLAALPINPWTIDDVLGFGEYAGRFFGEFGHGEMAALAAYQHLVDKYGARKAEQLFGDLLPLNDPRAPTSIAKRDGVFRRRTGRPVPTRYRGSRYANHDPAVLGAAVATTARAVDDAQARVRALQRRLALPRFGSNAVIVSGRLTKDRKPLLYGGPQTGWAVPGFFWEAEIHTPDRDARGVMVPGIPLFVIGRNAHAAWTVTSALDANADVFVEQLDGQDKTYVHRGNRLTVQSHTETIACKTPPSEYLGLISGVAPVQCPSAPTRITVHRTVHGASLADPDAHHRLYVRQSALDGRLLASLSAWDLAGRQQTVPAFGRVLAKMSLGFNFHVIDDRGDIGYWHTGAYPVRPRNADPTLPMPGGGRYDWQGLERWRAHPHVINPKRGFVVNWNNKPSVGWWSKNLETGGEGGSWGPEWESVPLDSAVRRAVPLDFEEMGQIPRQVAYVDNRARVFKPALLKALARATEPQLVAVRSALAAWNGGRDSGGPAIVFFDRFVEQLGRVVQEPLLGADWRELNGLECATCHLRSIDNLATPTYKFELPGPQLLARALRGHTRHRWIGDRNAVLFEAARAAAAQLTAEQGADATRWSQPVETGEYTAQGAASVAALSPLPNRGSYGQVVGVR